MKLFSRDLFYLVLLIMLVKVAISNRSGAPTASSEVSSESALIVNNAAQEALNPESAPAISQTIQPAALPSEPASAQSAAIVQPVIPAQETSDPAQSAYNFSDLEENLLLQIDAAQKQVDALIPHIKDTSEQAAHLRSLKQKLAHLRHAYQQSLAAPFFGPKAPIANESTTQQYVEKDLLRVVNKLGFIVHGLESKDREFTPADSVIKALQTNHGLIEKAIL